MRRKMRTFLLGLIVLVLMATAVVGICSEKEESATPEATTVLKGFLVLEGPTLISEEKYDKVLDLIADLSTQEREDVQIKTLECFANLKCWVCERKRICKTNCFTLRHNLILLGDSDATPLLLVFLKDNNEWMRKYAADLLGRIGDKRALKDLKAVGENDENRRVRKYARWAYEQISGEKF